jgi:NAD-dependent DNA ligase
MGVLAFLAERGRPIAAPTVLDDHGQPRNTAFRSAAVVDRQIDELIGITKGVLADGVVAHAEAEFVLNWLETNRSARGLWPASVLYPRLTAILADGVIDQHEEKELLTLIQQCVGGNAPAKGEASMSTDLPLTTPQPTIQFTDRAFCFTGKFYSGTRTWCEEQVVTRGSRVGAITKDLHYLVIGEVGSRDWIHSTHGRKIEKAVHYVERGYPIAIVAEQHWHQSLS